MRKTPSQGLPHFTIPLLLLVLVFMSLGAWYWFGDSQARSWIDQGLFFISDIGCPGASNPVTVKARVVSIDVQGSSGNIYSHHHTYLILDRCSYAVSYCRVIQGTYAYGIGPNYQKTDGFCNFTVNIGDEVEFEGSWGTSELSGKKYRVFGPSKIIVNGVSYTASTKEWNVSTEQ